MDRSDQKQYVWVAGALGFALLATAFSWYMSLPPSPLPADAPSGDFSAYRAIKHTEVMAAKPHPAGSAANRDVYQYILGQLKDMNVEATLNEPLRGGGAEMEFSRAVIGIIPGTDPTRSFAMDAHFDSVPYGPGGADDLAGISAMLETARAIKAGPPLRNDIVFVFADAEEYSAGGARTFRETPLFERVGVMLGLEARGSSGASLMFETTDQNGWVIGEMAKSGCSPRATSVMFDVYKRLPFASDFNNYKHDLPDDTHRAAGLNIAFVDEFGYYHTRLDNAENCNLASLQHHGEYCLKLARHFGNLDMSGDLRAPNATYFNVLGSKMVVYPIAWGWPLTYAATILFALVIVGGFFRGHLNPLGVLAGFLGVLGAVIVSTGVSALGSWVVWSAYREMGWYFNDAYTGSFVLFGLGMLLLFSGVLTKYFNPASLLAGGLAPWLVGTFLLQKYLPGGTYTTLWTLIFASLGLAVLYLADDPDAPPPMLPALSVVFALPAIFLIAPALNMFGYTLTFIAGAGVCALAILLASLLLPAFSLIPPRIRYLLPCVAMALGGLLFGYAYVANRPGPTTPLLNCLSVGVDFDANQAWYMSSDRKLDPWTKQFFTDKTQRGAVEEFINGCRDIYWKAPAPVSLVQKPIFEVREDTVEGSHRKIKLFFDSPRNSQDVDIRLVSENEVHAVSVNGKEMRGGGSDWELRLRLTPVDGTEITLEVNAYRPLQFLVREKSQNIPDGIPPRPNWMATEPNRTLDHGRPLRSEHTYSKCTFDFGDRPAGSGEVHSVFK